MPRLRYLDDQDQAPQITKPFVKRVLSYFFDYKIQMAGVVVLIIAAAALGVVPPLLLKNIVDEALPSHNMGYLAYLVGLSIGATVLLNLLSVAQGYLSTWISKRITFDIKNKLYHKLTLMPLAFFADVKAGDVTTRINSDVDGIQEVFRTTVVNALNAIFVLATTLFTLFSLNVPLALVSMVTVPLFILPTRKVGEVRFKYATKSQAGLSLLNQHVQETLSAAGSTLLKIFTQEAAATQTFTSINDEVTRIQIKESLAGRWFRMAMLVFTAIGPMLVYLVGGFLLTKETITIGGIVTFASLLTRLYSPVVSLSNMQVDFMRSFALFHRIFEYLDLVPAIDDRPEAQDVTIQEGEVIYEDVTFAYGDEPVVKGVSLAAKSGETVAFVGSSGAGKSTLTNLLPRLYDLDGGAITIDGVDIREMTLASLRSQIGVVTQEPYLFNGTIRENLLYGKEDASDEELVAACRAAYIHDFIASLPAGYDTQVGNRGIKLSGGEKQRVAIARVILKNPKILVLDEATSALDAKSEYMVQKAMVELLKGRTSFVIAHRLSTIQHADTIVVVEAGQIAEAGSHQELMEQNGLYRELYDTQFLREAERVA